MKLGNIIGVGIAGVSAAVVIGCVQPAQESENIRAKEQAWSSNALNPVHQDMTNEAVSAANAYMATHFGASSFFKGSRVVDGNEDTDCVWWDCGILDEYYGEEPDSIPTLHFMRRPTLSSREGCEASKNKILDAAVKALTAYRNGSTESFSYWIGHATHLIQDSTAQGHDKRSSTDLHRLLQMCVSGSPVPAGVCTHSNSADIDISWNGRSNEYKAGRDATIGFLKQLGVLAKKNVSSESTIRAQLRDVLENQLITNSLGYPVGTSYSGYFNCSTLSTTDKYTPAPPVPPNCGTKTCPTGSRCCEPNICTPPNGVCP